MLGIVQVCRCGPSMCVEVGRYSEEGRNTFPQKKLTILILLSRVSS